MSSLSSLQEFFNHAELTSVAFDQNLEQSTLEFNGFNQIHNIMNVKEFYLYCYALWKSNCASGSKPYVTHSKKKIWAMIFPTTSV